MEESIFPSAANISAGKLGDLYGTEKANDHFILMTNEMKFSIFE